MMSSPKVLILTSSFLPTIGGIQFELKWFLDSLDFRHLKEKGDIQGRTSSIRTEDSDTIFMLSKT